MPWKSTMRSTVAAVRKMEREAQRRQRELAKQRARLAVRQEREKAAYEVAIYEEYLDHLLSVHKECGPGWDWEAILASGPPAEPERSDTHQRQARELLDAFQPNLLDKLLGRVETKRSEFVQAAAEARKDDEREYRQALEGYRNEHAKWAVMHELSHRILDGCVDAYLDAVRVVKPFSHISQLGSSLDVQPLDSERAVVVLDAYDEKVIPAETKTLLKSGNLSVKSMPKTRFYACYQDHICGCTLRVARELFALLPLRMVIVNVQAELLNTQTGYLESQTILSVAVPRQTLERLNLGRLDPSDAMGNFVHHMNFRRTKGFAAVVPLDPTDLGA
jgi:hypothetical protein